MKKFISTLIMIIGHLFFIAIHYLSIKVNGIDWFQFLSFAIIHGLWYDFYLGCIKKRIYGLKQWGRQPQCYVGDYFLCIFIINTMATFKIKLGDKAAFLNRMEKQGETISSEEIKDNKLKDYFEVDIVEPKQLEVAKTILKQSPKINTIKEMANKLTKDALKEMIRQELSGVIAEKKKMKDEDKKKKLDEDVTTGSEMAAKQMMGAISSGDPFAIGVGLVSAVALGVLTIPTAINKIKGYYAALKQEKEEAKAASLKDIASKEGIDITSA